MLNGYPTLRTIMLMATEAQSMGIVKVTAATSKLQASLQCVNIKY